MIALSVSWLTFLFHPVSCKAASALFKLIFRKTKAWSQTRHGLILRNIIHFVKRQEEDKGRSQKVGIFRCWQYKSRGIKPRYPLKQRPTPSATFLSLYSIRRNSSRYQRPNVWNMAQSPKGRIIEMLTGIQKKWEVKGLEVFAGQQWRCRHREQTCGHSEWRQGELTGERSMETCRLPYAK